VAAHARQSDPLPAATPARLEALFLPRSRGRVHRQRQGQRPLEELLAGEVLEVRVVDPALAYLFIGQGEDVLEQQKPDHEAGLDPGPALVAVERRDLAVETGSIRSST
jgi:hypothetical protein